ncbi:MAG TPA: glucoamylase family protein [Candidatus Eisenbacteria bacterium]|nr:glucoamylase family protein [Candidatus Eisenbacteria bacterium]
MATGMELILNLRSAREWHSALEESGERSAIQAAAEETARRLERILAAARRDALKTQAKQRRRVTSPMADDLALHEAQISGAIQYLQRRQASGAFLEGDWRALTASNKVIEEAFGESRAALRLTEELPLLAGAREGQLRIRVVGERFLEAAEFVFERQELVAFLASLQEEAELTNAEVATLKGFLSQVLLEQVAAHARKLVMPGRNTSASREEALPGLRLTLSSLKSLVLTDWDELFVETSLCEQALAQDPAGAFEKMEKAAKSDYRSAVAQLARDSGESEAEVARRAVKLAKTPYVGTNARANERRSHVGFYLIGEGHAKLEEALGVRRSVFTAFGRFLKRWPDGLYVVGIELLMIGLLSAVVIGAEVRVPTFLVMALFLLPAAESAVAIANQLAVMFARPRAMPKMDYSKGIPAESKTLVIVPTLLINRGQMERAVRDLEIRFLGNRDANLHFGLLTDPPDAPTQFDKRDELGPECAKLIEGLNRQYAGQGRGSFFLFHRNRTFNAVEKIWMGWERKRGKLLDLNNLLLAQSNNFSVIAGDQSLLAGFKYVITLDADTQLPRDSAYRLVGAMAHPMQRAVIHPVSNVVVEGYGILQPRVGISIHSANRSRLASLFSGDSTFDVYTRAVSDVYQDLFGEGSFTGKGIYEIEVFQRVLEQRFPCNSILSHDMIEGAYARAGLLSDVEVIDDYPSRIAAYSKRKHRWVRGDWQILFWLFPRVPDYFGNVARNPINLISRWKILDNLRRSLTEIATLAILVSGWLFLPGKAIYWTLATLAMFAAPAYLQFTLAILRSGNSKFTARFWKEWFADFSAGHAHLFMRLVCLPQQSMVTLDAIVRVVVRMALTRRKLLEWETAAEAEAGKKRSPVDIYLAATPWLAFLGGVFLAIDRPDAFLIAWPLLLLWGASREFCNWLDQPLPEDGLKISDRDEALLRNSALRTWRFFREMSNEQENYLIPDIFKEEGKLTAHRVSTTNLGLLLNARVAAVDLGHLTFREFIAETEKTLATVRRLPKAHGHLFNWYDNRTLEPVGDPFLSTVDNGNLVCCLWTLKQACLEELKRPIFRKELWAGIRDHARLIQQLAPTKEVRKAVRGLEECIAKRGPTPLEWLSSLPALEQAAATLLEVARPTAQKSEELQWWLAEFDTRVSALHDLAVHFAPWASTKFRTLRAEEKQQTKWIADLSLTEAARVYDEIADVLREENRGLQSEGAAENISRELLRDALASARENALQATSALSGIAAYADELAAGMDFSLVYDAPRKLVTIGFDAAKDAASEHHYDLLASEARAAVFAGVAKGEIPQECWFHLDRSHVRFKGERVLQSWTGTMFEYLMPSLWMKSSAGTLLDRNMSSAVRAQQKHARRYGIPWGVSESACSLISGDGHYHYFAFGVPALALHRPDDERVVISPYSTFMSLMTGSYDALRNLRRLKKMGAVGAYGFYEALDYGPRMTLHRKRFTMVRSWMAHHQGMCLLSIANVLCDSAIQRRFHAEPQVAATERILHERANASESLDVSRAQRKRKAEALLTEGQSVLSPSYWEAKDRAQTTA